MIFPAEAAPCLAGGDVPQAQGAVAAARGEETAVGREGKDVDRRPVPQAQRPETSQRTSGERVAELVDAGFLLLGRPDRLLLPRPDSARCVSGRTGNRGGGHGLFLV